MKVWVHIVDDQDDDVLGGSDAQSDPHDGSVDAVDHDASRHHHPQQQQQQRRRYQRVCWYVGTSDLMVDRAIRLQLALPHAMPFLLRDADGDLVPVSSSLPHDQTFTIVRMDEKEEFEDEDEMEGGSRGTKRRRFLEPAHPIDAASSETSPNDIYNSNEAAVTTAATVDPTAIAPVPARWPTPELPMSPTRLRSPANVIVQFLETFTVPIPDDDNINFIPNHGEYSIFELYCRLFDASLHPKSQNGFYKVTSMQGKIDRQRVIRYYKRRRRPLPGPSAVAAPHLPGIECKCEHEYAIFRPEGKGLLLRKYRPVLDEAAIVRLIERAGYVRLLDLQPHEVVMAYLAFVHGFEPVSRAEYQTHRFPGAELDGDEENPKD